MAKYPWIKVKGEITAEEILEYIVSEHYLHSANALLAIEDGEKGRDVASRRMGSVEALEHLINHFTEDGIEVDGGLWEQYSRLIGVKI